RATWWKRFWVSWRAHRADLLRRSRAEHKRINARECQGAGKIRCVWVIYSAAMLPSSLHTTATGGAAMRPKTKAQRQYWSAAKLRKSWARIERRSFGG